MKNQRGLSTVVTTLIIIVLVIVAVGIVWVVINNLLKSSTEEMEYGRIMISLEIEQARVEGINVIVTVKRNYGKGELVGISFILESDTDSEIIENYTAIEELGKKTFTLTPTTINVNDLTLVSVAPIFETESGEKRTGNPLDDKVIERGECVPLDCSGLGYECGSQVDNCGNSIDCGGCSSGAVCRVGQCVNRIIFVSAIQYSGNLEGVSGADAKCNSDANKPSGERGEFKAILGAPDRPGAGYSGWVLEPITDYYRTDGNKIDTTNANGWFDFDLQNSIGIGPDVYVWTGLNINGEAYQDGECRGWTDTLGRGVIGASFLTNSGAFTASDVACSSTRYLYCVEQP